MVPSYHINEKSLKPVASSRLTYCSTLYWATLTDEKYFNSDSYCRNGISSFENS